MITEYEVDPSRPLDLEPVAVLSRPPNAFQALGIRFIEDFDDLDAFQLALFDLGDHEPVGLMRYRGEPEGQTSLLLRRTLDERERGSTLVRVLAALSLTRHDIAWERAGRGASLTSL
jgi:hypothetical protein